MTDDPAIEIYVYRIQNKVTFKIKSGYYLDLFTLDTMSLLGTVEEKITQDKNGESVYIMFIVISSTINNRATHGSAIELFHQQIICWTRLTISRMSRLS